MNFSPSLLFGLLGVITGVFSLGMFWQHKDYQNKINNLSRQINTESIKRNHLKPSHINNTEDMALLLEANLAKQTSKPKTTIDRQDGQNYSVNRFRLIPKEIRKTPEKVQLELSKSETTDKLKPASKTETIIKDIRSNPININNQNSEHSLFLSKAEFFENNQNLQNIASKNPISHYVEMLIYLGLFIFGYLALKIAFNTNLNLSYLIGIFFLLSLLIWNCCLVVFAFFKKNDFSIIKKVLFWVERIVSVFAVVLTFLLVSNFQLQYFLNYDNWSSFWQGGGGLIWSIILALKLIFRVLTKYNIGTISKTLPLDILQHITFFLISLSSLLIFNREFVGIILAMLVLFVTLVYVLAIRERNKTILIKNLMIWLGTWTLVTMFLIYNNVFMASFFGLVMMLSLKYIGLIRRYRYAFFISNVLLLLLVFYFALQVFRLSLSNPIIAWCYLLASIYLILERQALIKRKIGWQFLASISYCLGFVLAIIFGYLSLGGIASQWNLILISIILSLLVSWLSIIEKQPELITVASLPFYLGLVQLSGVGKFDMNFLAILIGCGSLIWLLIAILAPKMNYKNYFLIGAIIGPFLNFLTTFGGVTIPWALTVNLIMLVFVLVYQKQIFDKKSLTVKYLTSGVLILNIFWFIGLFLGGKYLNLSVSIGIAIMVVLIFGWIGENKKNNYNNDHQVLIN